MDSDYQLDIAEVRRQLQATEVVGFYFPFLRQTLLVDQRTNSVDPPFIAVVPMVDSVDERVRSLKRLRPRFPRPASMMLVPWPKFVGALMRLGVQEMIETRLTELGGETMRERCGAAIAELLRMERVQVRNAVTGDGYETIWERRS